MPFKVKISDGNEILVDEGNTILEAALDQGIDFPHGCRSGNCGACKSKKFLEILKCLLILNLRWMKMKKNKI